MDTFNALKQLGVNHFGIINAGKILGIMESAKEAEQIRLEKIREHSWGIAVDIAENLLLKIHSSPNTALKDYLADKVVHWIQSSLGWTEYEVVFKENVLVKIPKSNFEKFNLTKDEFLDYLNASWIYEKNSKYSLVRVTDVPDSELDIQFFFNLKFF